MSSNNLSRSVSALSFLLLSIFAVQPANAQNGNGGSALGDVIVWAIEEALRTLFGPVEQIVRTHGNEAIEYAVGTPHPNAVFIEPTNNAWPSFYAYFWDTIIPLALLLWALSIGIVIFLESTSYLFSGYHRAKLKRRAFAGLLGILAWWWMDALARQFIHELTVFLAPDLSQIGLFETLSFTGIGAIGIVITMSVDFVLLALVFLIYVIREVMLYLFTLLMPLLIVFWIPGVGPFALVSKLMRRLAGFYVPFLFMTVPVALLFRIGALLGENFGLTVNGLGAWLVALVLPIAAILSPFVLFWQAGALMFTADRMASHTSTQRAKQRASKLSSTARDTAHGGRNFYRGAQGEMALNRDGQSTFQSGSSRAHAAGSRLNTAGSKLRSTFSRSTDDSESAQADAGSESGESDTSTDRNQRFDTLRSDRDPDSRTEKSNDGETRSNRDGYSDDDRPRYIN